MKRPLTKLASYEERLDAWKAAKSATEDHIDKGVALQKQGENILESLEASDLGAELAIKLLHQATTIIEKGIKIERDARDKLLLLYQSVPKNFHARLQKTYRPS